MVDIEEEKAFIAFIEANPFDLPARLVFADWLDEHDETAKSQYLRFSHELVFGLEAIDLTSPRVEELLKVSKKIDLAWRQSVGVKVDLHFEGVFGVGVLVLLNFFRRLVGMNISSNTLTTEKKHSLRILTGFVCDEAIDFFFNLGGISQVETSKTHSLLVLRPATPSSKTNSLEVIEDRASDKASDEESLEETEENI